MCQVIMYSLQEGDKKEQRSFVRYGMGALHVGKGGTTEPTSHAPALQMLPHSRCFRTGCQ